MKNGVSLALFNGTRVAELDGRRERRPSLRSAHNSCFDGLWSIAICVSALSLAGCQKAAAPDCAANATRYQVIHKLAVRVLGVPIPESEAAWKKIEDDATSHGVEVRHHDGTMSFYWKSKEETIQFYLSDVRAQSHMKSWVAGGAQRIS
jgi:hypothetical protein